MCEVSIRGEGDFKGSVIKEFEIKPKKINPTLILTPGTFKYKGKELVPEITVKDGDTIIPRDNYSLLMSRGRKDPGTYRIRISLKNNYEGETEKTYTIEPRDSLTDIIKRLFS